MRQSQQNPTDQTTNFFWALILIFLAALAIWFFDARYVVMPFYWLRVHEIDLMRYVALWWIPVAKFFHFPLPDMDRLDALQHYLQTVDPGHVSWSEFSAVNTDIGHWTRYPIIVILMAMAIFMFFHYGTARFHKFYTMKALREWDQPEWLQITPIVSLDLINEDINQGPWAMAKPPLEFCRENQLLLLKVANNKKIWALKQKSAYRVFVMQLGSLWPGMDALPIHIQALAVIFMARITGQRPLSKILMEQIAASAATEKLDFSGVSEHIKTFYGHKFIRWVEARHAYVTTFMATLLEMARSDGVLATAEFLWLKPVDRRLWYVLNNVGRRTAIVEVAGIISHWQAEKQVHRALKTPMVKYAVDALDETLQNILYVEQEDRWRTTNAD